MDTQMHNLSKGKYKYSILHYTHFSCQQISYRLTQLKIVCNVTSCNLTPMRGATSVYVAMQ